MVYSCIHVICFVFMMIYIYTIQYNETYGVSSASLVLQNIGLSIVLSIQSLTSLTRQNSDRVPHFIGACEYMYGQYLGLCLPTTQLLTPIRMCWFLCLQVKGPPKSPYKKRVVNFISWITMRISIEIKCCMCCRQMSTQQANIIL